MLRVVDVNPLPDFRLRLRYSDGVEGVVDLSHLVGKGVFRIWDQPGIFELEVAVHGNLWLQVGDRDTHRAEVSVSAEQAGTTIDVPLIRLEVTPDKKDK